MKLEVNGEPFELAAGETLGALIVAAGADPNRVAVVVDGEVVPRSERAAWPLRGGERIEILSFAGGG